MRNKKLLLVIGVVALAAFLVVILKPGGTKKNSLPSTDRTETNEFEKEGELWFLNGEDTIKHIDIEFASSRYEITKGLMDRRVMQEDEGMLFIFDRMEPRSFWMKNTPLSLDIIYITDGFEIESIQKNTEPYSPNSIPSKGDAQYVLEVNAGFSDKFNIVEGTRITYKANP